MRPPGGRIARRLFLGAALAAVACRPAAKAGPSPAPPPLRALAPFPLGASITADLLADPAAVSLLLANFSQITPGLEMKMERVLRPDGGLDFQGADRIAGFARSNDLRLHGHTLVWYIYRPPSFERLRADPAAFGAAYRRYVLDVAGRYRGQVAGWDVVNEPVAEDGEGLRDCLWREALGLDYIARAFHHAREADPQARLFLNEYNLHSRPAKRATFLRLAEDLLARGVPLGGLGTQMHMRWDEDGSGIAPMMRELAALGLPIHVSELDVSTHAGALEPTGLTDRLQRQADLVAITADAFRRLPSSQRYAFSFWGLRDSDSCLRTRFCGGDPADAPLLFDDAGRPKPAAAALARVLTG